MKRPFLLVAGAAAAGLLIAGIGASAHTLGTARFTGVHGATFGDEASGARTEPAEPTKSPEPAEQPEAPKASEPAEPPETDEQGDDNEQKAAPVHQAAPAGSGEHEDGAGDKGD